MIWIVLLILWAFSFRLSRWGKRYLAEHGASTSTTPGSGVSRNQTGPKWEQDVPISEAELDMEDDL